MSEGPLLSRPIRDNCLKEAQPPEAGHQSARRMETAIRRCQESVRFSELPSVSGAFCAIYGSSARAGLGVRVATEVFGFWLLIHAGLKHERRCCSMPPSEIQWD